LHHPATRKHQRANVADNLASLKIYAQPVPEWEIEKGRNGGVQFS
jgi:hypothetical protein